MDVRRQAIIASGLLTRRELLARGTNDREVRAALRAGHLLRVSHGVYGLPRSGSESLVYSRTSRDFEQLRFEHRRLVCSKVLRAEDPLVSHVSAALLLGLPLVDADLGVVHITGRLPNGGQRRGVVFRHPRGAGIPEIRVDGIRMTTAARTLVDVARTESVVAAVTAMDAALHRAMVVREDLESELAAATGRRGVSTARRAVALADGRSESPGESKTRILLHDLGFPSPELQVNVLDGAGHFLGRADLAYAEFGVLIEFDGLVKYGDIADGPEARTALIKEKRREDRLRAAGFVVLRLVWSDLGDRDQLRRLLSDAMDQGRRAVAAGIVTGTMVAA